MAWLVSLHERTRCRPIPPVTFVEDVTVFRLRTAAGGDGSVADSASHEELRDIPLSLPENGDDGGIEVFIMLVAEEEGCVGGMADAVAKDGRRNRLERLPENVSAAICIVVVHISGGGTVGAMRSPLFCGARSGEA